MNPDIGRKEIAFLDKEDLLTFANSPDEAMATLEPLIENTSVWLHNLFRKVGSFSFISLTLRIAMLIRHNSAPTKAWL